MASELCLFFLYFQVCVCFCSCCLFQVILVSLFQFLSFCSCSIISLIFIIPVLLFLMFFSGCFFLISSILHMFGIVEFVINFGCYFSFFFIINFFIFKCSLTSRNASSWQARWTFSARGPLGVFYSGLHLLEVRAHLEGY